MYNGMFKALKTNCWLDESGEWCGGRRRCTVQLIKPIDAKNEDKRHVVWNKTDDRVASR